MQILDTKSKSLSFSNAIYNRLISIYPASFKLSFRKELEQVFDNKTRSVYQKSGWLGVSAFWLRTLLDTFQTAFREHIEEFLQMKFNPKKTTTSGFALIAGLLTVFIVVSNWVDFPYPFPSSFSFNGIYWTFNMIDEDDLEVRNYLEDYKSKYIPEWEGFSAPPVLPSNFFEDVLGEAPGIPSGQKPSYLGDDYPFRYLLGTTRLNNNFIAVYSPSHWNPDMVRGTMSIWENHSSPNSILLPVLWLGVLILMMAFTKLGKLGSFGLSAGIIGNIIMILTMEELFRTNLVPSTVLPNYLWIFFSFGSILLGAGLILFGVGTIRHKALSGWNALPIGMGVAQISMEVIGRVYTLTDLVLWPRVQGVLLLFVGLSWIVLGLRAFKFNKLDLSPA